MKPFGVILVIILVLFPLYWFAPLTSQYNTLAVISQYFGSASLILMGISQFFATRAYGIETIFGGLDRIYVLHKWMAVAAIIFAALHDTIDAEMDELGDSGFLHDLAETMGELGFYGLLILTIITLITFIPYHYWKWSHRFIGFFFAMSAFHYVFILKPFDNFDPVGFYVLAFCILGILSYLYLLLPKRWTSENTHYTIKTMQKINDTVEIELTPKNKGIAYTAGQFAFISFDIEGSAESHPFTISSSPNKENNVRFTIKSLGDHTRLLGNQLAIGQSAMLSRAYGHFTRKLDGKPEAWIAAGIGITPFMAWAQTLDSSNLSAITLYYCVSSREQALYLKELTEVDAKVENFTLKLIVSGIDERLNTETIKTDLGSEIKQARVYFCGPTKMREQLQEGFKATELPNSSFNYEAFELRSGIGIRKALAWFMNRYGDRLTNRFLER